LCAGEKKPDAELIHSFEPEIEETSIRVFIYDGTWEFR
jgi:hypothetical protein